MGSKHGTVTIRKRALMMFLNIISFCLRLSCFPSLRNFDSTLPIGAFRNCDCPCVVLYCNVSLKHKPVIEPNSSTESWYSTEREVYFLTQSRQSVCDSSSWIFSSSALLLDSYSSPSSATPTEWPTSPVRSTACPGQCLSGTRNWEKFLL